MDKSRLLNKNNRNFGLESCKIMQIKNQIEVKNILFSFDSVFNPKLSKRLPNLDIYSKKVFKYAEVYAAVDNYILGFVAFYANDKKTNIAYLTQIAVQPEVANRGIGRMLLEKCIKTSKANGMSILKLEVYKYNLNAIRFYEKNGFDFYDNASVESIYMIKRI
jgi:ribosomal protein S18 acetylase RimI-like enzyme